jgi:hypothetical protein
MSEATYVPLRERGVTPVPIDWTFKTAPRWKRRMMIERAYAIDEAQHAARLSARAAAELQSHVLHVGDLAGAELDAAVRRHAAAVLVGRHFADAPRWSRGHKAKTWSFAAPEPTTVTMLRGDARTSATFWPAEVAADLERELARVAPGCGVRVRPGSGRGDVLLVLPARAEAAGEEPVIP